MNDIDYSDFVILNTKCSACTSLCFCHENVRLDFSLASLHQCFMVADMAILAV